ncbi:M1-specific T cell receptor beta chain-like isoform X1 [Sebastes umbrosus]|uniref:M1-specific T cell receptor beta chain-like isoform X1 n=1 Tax=Sebastes umbrosus TaxID=72105 RepID=UPI00189E04B2|nr:M1-specific T cell receptor beta chain-like isoform X1 [Sebastes umbrosus]
MLNSVRLNYKLCICFVSHFTSAHVTGLNFSVRQQRGFVSANVGNSVTLQCFCEGSDPAWLYWYKQTPGQKPQLISSTYMHDIRVTFHHEFKNNPRFTVDKENSNNHLTILDLRISDSAIYYCAASASYVLYFSEGTLVSVQGSGLNIPALVQQSASETVQPGGSVTLNCTVHTGTCDGEHSVYWYRNSEESHPGLIYTHGGRNDQCEKKPNTQTHTCVYNLPIKSLNRSHVGTYYCAVASCGHILFGNGTKLDFKDEEASLVLVYFLSGALAFTTILVVILALSVYKVNKRNSCQCAESHGRLSAPSTENAEGYRDADSLHYAALSVNLTNRSRRPRNNTNDECVYSSVKQ